MYSFTSRVRYSEVDKSKNLDLSSIIDYFQDCSTFQSEELHVGIDFLEQRNKAWLMSSWQIVVNRFPTLGDAITTSTWAYDFNTMYGYRNFIMKDCNDTTCAYANSIWVFVDTKLNRPTKLTPEFTTCYPIEERFPMNYAPRKIITPMDFVLKDPFLVVQSNIDTNNHVNNGQYIRMAEEYLPPDFTIRQMRADYRSSAVLGDTIIPKVSTTDKACTIILTSSEDKPYAIVEFLSELE